MHQCIILISMGERSCSTSCNLLRTLSLDGLGMTVPSHGEESRKRKGEFRSGDYGG